MPYKQNLKARTQVTSEDLTSRPDLILYNEEKPYVLVESKIWIKSNKAQQVRHSLIKATHNFLIARDPVLKENLSTRFIKITWYDFFSFLSNSQKIEKSSIDFFLITKLINFGKECKMLLPDRITKEDFENANILLTQTRLRENPSYSFERKNPFQSFDLICQFLERILIKMKDDVHIGSKLRPFTKRLNISSLYYKTINKKVLLEKPVERRRELRLKYESVILNKEIKLKKSVKEFSSIYVRASFEPYYKDKETWRLSFQELLNLDLKQISYRCDTDVGLVGTNMISTSLACYDDQDDLDFAKFYSEAVKAFNKKVLN